MKLFLHKGKRMVALVLAMSMFCPQVFAAEALSAKEQGVQEAPVAEQVVLPQLTVEEALDKAKKHDPELKNIEDSLELLTENQADIDDAFGSVSLPSYDYEKWTDQWLYDLYNGVYQIEQGMKQAKLGRSLQKLVLEVTIKTFSKMLESLASKALLIF